MRPCSSRSPAIAPRYQQAIGPNWGTGSSAQAGWTDGSWPTQAGTGSIGAGSGAVCGSGVHCPVRQDYLMPTGPGWAGAAPLRPPGCPCCCSRPPRRALRKQTASAAAIACRCCRLRRLPPPAPCRLHQRPHRWRAPRLRPRAAWRLRRQQPAMLLPRHRCGRHPRRCHSRLRTAPV